MRAQDADELVGLTADERLLSQDPANLPAAIGRPPDVPPSPTRGRLVGIGATLTGLTLIGGIALIIAGAIDLVSGGGLLGIVAIALGLGLAGTHWGWVHVAEATADAIEDRRNRGILDERRQWLEAIAPFARHEIATSVADDGGITIEGVSFLPTRTTDRRFAFTREVELTEHHSADEPAAVVAERAELLRRQAMLETERERARFHLAADALETTLIAGDDDRQQLEARVAASRALSEQINANLRNPPLAE